MKKFLLLGLIGVMLNCDRKKASVPQSAACGNFMALKNKQEWTATPTATLSGTDSANVMIEECRVPHTSGEVEWLSLNQLPLKAGNYSLQSIHWDDINGTPLSAWIYTAVGGDATGERYNLYKSRTEKSVLTIDAYNPTTREVKGHLNATFVADPETRPADSRADTIRIQDAVFSVVVNG